MSPLIVIYREESHGSTKYPSFSWIYMHWASASSKISITISTISSELRTNSSINEYEYSKIIEYI